MKSWRSGQSIDVSLMSWHEEGTPVYPNCEELWKGLPIDIREMQSGPEAITLGMLVVAMEDYQLEKTVDAFLEIVL